MYEGGETNGPEDIDFSSIMPRTLPNGDLSLPFSACFVMKKIDAFDEQSCKLDVAFTFICRIKVTGIENHDEIVDFIINKLKVRVSEEEGPLMNDARSGKFVFANSKDGEKDIIQFTLRCKEQFTTSFDQFVDYPFDNLLFKYRFEFSHFELKDENKKTKAVVRFDFYPTKESSAVSWKEEVDALPEFDIDYGHTCFLPIVEKKMHKDKETKTEIACYYYPGFIFCIKTIRDPFPKIIRAFVPAMILGVFLYCTFQLDSADAYADRLANLSICLLTYIAIMDQLRSGLPEIS